MPILLFDGHCNLCNAWIQFIVKRDSAGTIRFASLQSGAGRRLLEEHKIDENYIESLVFFEEERFSVSSTAVLRTLSYLDELAKTSDFYDCCASFHCVMLVYRFFAKISLQMVWQAGSMHDPNSRTH